MKRCTFSPFAMGVVLCFACLFCGCKKNEMEQESKKVNRVSQYVQPHFDKITIPTATDEELERVSGFECYEKYRYLDYRIARDCAFAEFFANVENYYPESIIKELKLPNLSEEREKLSFGDRPVIVYDYKNRPYYYEFPILYAQEYLVGTVTVAAQPGSEELIEYLFPYPIQYGEFSFHYKRYVGEYPVVYYGLGDSKYFYAETEMLDKDKSVEKLVPVENTLLITNKRALIMEKIARTLSEEEKKQMEEDLHETAGLPEAENKCTTLSEYADLFVTPNSIYDYWLKQTEFHSKNTKYEFDITPEMKDLIQKNIDEISAQNVYFLPEYANHRLRLTRWEDFCGPSALSWTYRGKYDNYRGKYLPLLGDNYTNDEYEYFFYQIRTCSLYEYSVYDFKPNVLPNTYATRKKKSDATDNGLYYTFFKETVKTGEQFPLYDGGIRRGVKNATNGEYKIRFITTPIAWMQKYRQPVLVEGINGDAHYWAAIGYAYNEGWLGIKKNMRIFVADNGYRMTDHNYYPYWSILGGLNYAWERCK